MTAVGDGAAHADVDEISMSAQKSVRERRRMAADRQLLFERRRVRSGLAGGNVGFNPAIAALLVALFGCSHRHVVVCRP
jgi:hypothetical protein